MDHSLSHSNFKKYFSFFWPLSLMGIAMLSGRLAQNYVLLQFDNGVRELAVYALVVALVQPLRSAVALVPQMVTFWTTSEQARRQCLVFIIGLGIILTCPLLLMAWTPLGAELLRVIYGLDGENATTAAVYMRYLSPVLMSEAIRQYITGLLIREKRTMWVTLLRTLDLVVILLVLLGGVMLGKSAVATVGTSALAASLVSALASICIFKSVHKPIANSGDVPHVSKKVLFSYFWPLAGTTIFFTLSRPIIFKLVTCLPEEMNPTSIIAALSLTFNVGMVFQLTVNQFRHLLVRYLGNDPAGVKSFMMKITVAITALMLALQICGGLDWFLENLQNATGVTLQMASDGLWILCLGPAIVAWRNYYHGLAMIRKKTTSMAIGGVSRNASAALFGLIFLYFGILNHWTAASLIIIAFLFEGLTVMLLQKVSLGEVADSC